ncbi:MAG: phytanoyl-CoA dioxygenase family protein [Saprospiraceae bacterium]|nr:phytanoyl-CoA dioxygenase family protein [Saprospiraceae bacterium]
MREQFSRDGYTVVRSLFSPEQIAFYKQELDALSVGRSQKWTLPDGVCQNRPFWDVIFNEKILAAVRGLLGEEIKFLQHNDLHVGFSSFHWHRDSVCRSFGKGPDWDESAEPYQLVRVGIYLQEKTGGFRLGLVKGTHRPDRLPDNERHFIESKLSGLTKALSLIGGKDPLHARADWVATEPGDCVIFDPRAIHTGSDFQGTKYSFFVAYGVENSHFRNHYNYYRHLREDLNYQTLHPELAARLRDAGLYADESFDGEPIEGAWLPSKAFSMVARQFK